MFQFPGFPPGRLWIHLPVTALPAAGFPHSDIKGSMPACGSPLLFAACHVLLRRLVPWHPPCALLRLITLLRLLAFSSGQLTFQFATGLSRLFSSSSLCSCQGAREISLPLRLPFGILKTIQIRERQFFLRTLFRALPSSVSRLSLLPLRPFGLFGNRPRFETSAFASVCSLERR